MSTRHGHDTATAAAAAAAAACDVPCPERSLARLEGTTGSAAADRLSGCPVVDQLCRGLRVVDVE